MNEGILETEMWPVILKLTINGILNKLNWSKIKPFLLLEIGIIFKQFMLRILKNLFSIVLRPQFFN